METVSVSTKYQVVIPRAARKQLHIEPGQKGVVCTSQSEKNN